MNIPILTLKDLKPFVKLLCVVSDDHSSRHIKGNTYEVGHLSCPSGGVQCINFKSESSAGFHNYTVAYLLGNNTAYNDSARFILYDSLSGEQKVLFKLCRDVDRL